jgi:hypothetical protein
VDDSTADVKICAGDCRLGWSRLMDGAGARRVRVRHQGQTARTAVWGFLSGCVTEFPMMARHQVYLLRALLDILDSARFPLKGSGILLTQPGSDVLSFGYETAFCRARARGFLIPKRRLSTARHPVICVHCNCRDDHGWPSSCLSRSTRATLIIGWRTIFFGLRCLEQAARLGAVAPCPVNLPSVPYRV